MGTYDRAGPDRHVAADHGTAEAPAPGRRTRTARPHEHRGRLDPDAREQMESAFGESFAGVTTGEGGLASTLGVQAVARGEHVDFASGAYQPDTPEGLTLIGHELTHVVQQRRGAVGVQAKGGIVRDPRLESEADDLGGRAARGESVSPCLIAHEPAAPRRDSLVAIDVAAGGDAAMCSGDPVAVQITNYGGNMIGGVTIIGRPPAEMFNRKSFKSSDKGVSEGDHTTAWAVHVDAVTHAMHEQRLDDALDNLNDLYQTASTLPVVKRKDELDEDRAARLAHYEHEVEAAAKACERERGTNSTELVSALQDYAAAILGYRNSLPLSTVYLGTAVSGGEPNNLRTLRGLPRDQEGWNEAEAPTEDDVYQAIARLFSTKVHHATGHNEVDLHGRAPGMRDSEKNADLEDDLLQTHLDWILAAYPWIEEAPFEITLAKLKTEMRKISEREGKNPGYNEDPPETLAVQLRAENQTITSVQIAGRPPKEAFAGGVEGSHTTAWAVARVGVIEALTGTGLADAVAALHRLTAYAMQLPGADATRIAAMETDRRDLLENATTDLLDARDDAVRCAEADVGPHLLLAVQRYAAAYLSYRNSLPLSVIDCGKPASGLGEPEALGTIGKGKDLLQSFWGLLDLGSLLVASDPEAHVESEQVPVPGSQQQQAHDYVATTPGRRVAQGVAEDGDEVVAAIIAQHWLSLEASFPSQVASLRMPPSDLAAAIAAHLTVEDKDSWSDDEAPRGRRKARDKEREEWPGVGNPNGIAKRAVELIVAGQDGLAARLAEVRTPRGAEGHDGEGDEREREEGEGEGDNAEGGNGDYGYDSHDDHDGHDSQGSQDGDIDRGGLGGQFGQGAQGPAQAGQGPAGQLPAAGQPTRKRKADDAGRGDDDGTKRARTG